MKNECPDPNADDYHGAMVGLSFTGWSFSKDFLGIENLAATELNSVRHFTKSLGYPANHPIRTEMAGETTSFYDVGVLTGKVATMSVAQLRQLETNIIGCDDSNFPEEAVFQFPLQDVTISYATSSGEMPTELGGDYNLALLCPQGPTTSSPCASGLRHVKRGGVWVKGTAVIGAGSDPTKLTGAQRTALCAAFNLIQPGECPSPIENVEVEVYLDPEDRGTCQTSYFHMRSDVFPSDVLLPKLKFGTAAHHNQGLSAVDVGTGRPFFVLGGMTDNMEDIIDTVNLPVGLTMPNGFAVTRLGATETSPPGRRRRRLKLTDVLELASSSGGSDSRPFFEADGNYSRDGHSSTRVVVSPNARRLDEEEIPFTYGEAEFTDFTELTRFKAWTTFRKGETITYTDAAIKADATLIRCSRATAIQRLC